MGLDNKRIGTAPESRLSWLANLVNRGGSKSVADPEPSIQELLDQLDLTGSQAPTVAPQQVEEALSLLAQPGQGDRLNAAGWQALSQAYTSGTGLQRAQLASRLNASGFQVAPSDDGRFLTFTNGTTWVTSEAATQRLRKAGAGRVECYEAGTLVKTMRLEANAVTVTTARGSEVWQTGNGQGYADGLPIVPRFAPRDPAEAPRGPWASSTRNDLREPAWTQSTPMTEYAPAYDAAVEAMGGEVVEPSEANEPAKDVYNCHSYATTDGAGDLFDPFSRSGFPHWLNNPMHRLTTGPFARIAEDQRVQPGDVIVYRQGDKVTHTGVVREVDANGNPSLIESKFGTLGLYRHEPHDIPAQYGGPAEFFRPDASTWT